MNCEKCFTPMMWVGSMSRGGMDCPKCAQERPVVFDMGRKQPILCKTNWADPLPPAGRIKFSTDGYGVISIESVHTLDSLYSKQDISIGSISMETLERMRCVQRRSWNDFMDGYIENSVWRALAGALDNNGDDQ